ncbi:serine hydrolase [Paucilactobacillus nenjiangensis]|uniref:serine hydrolase n=1 Tax=Paucilactobacillus nenjiangensis TaxID=1296540 RepID=UPI003BAF36AC
MKKAEKKFLKAIISVVGILLIAIIGYQYVHTSKASSGGTAQTETQKEVAKRQKIIKENLTNYLKTVTDDGTVSVSFYNLGATSGSTAAKSKYADVYKKGELQVESNAHTAQTTASTYKLFITAYLMQQKLNGNFTWNSTNEDGFYRMIVNSENDFAEERLQKYGMSKINKFISNQGWYSPVFQTDENATSTSYSLQLLLEQLEAGTGSFSNASDRAKILKLMGKQIYRTGIPAGVAAADKGTTVSDKVGFLDDTNNYAAIVTMPNGQKYILVIMTHGHNQSGFSGFPKIAKIAKKVQQIVYGADAVTKLEDYSN